MRLERAVMAAISNAVEVAPPATIAESVAAFGGTRATAEALGVTQRTVQRWIKGERGDKGETRRPNAAQREALAERAAEKQSDSALSRMRRNGVKADYEGEANVSGETGRQRGFSFTIEPGDELDALLDAYEDGSTRTAAGAFEDAVSEFYVPGMELGDVDELVISY